MGLILKIILPLNFTEATWRITDRVSITNTPPIISKNNSALVNSATDASAPPKAREPTSPKNILAG